MARVNTRQLITEAAVSVAAQHGISGASMDLIAETAGVAKGSLYYNFASKDALFEEVIRGGFEKLAVALDEARAATQADPAAGPRAVAAATLETLRGNLDLAKLMASEIFRTDRPWADTMELARASVVVRYRDVLRAARDGDPVITETAGAAFFGALAGACLDWLLFRPEQSVDTVLDQVLGAGSGARNGLG
ncbi:TetR/AcrR family transcriptional regulator [Leucobacter rhizosphaerae]|uniref:TetR/AcrR family transcriptional regulator n=1 Tax=Leucobacter rhizosphaerae TaxID=2932245 RepID=A0ABY4FUA3_9MICO|nr:TetR/AcrR family transcriptional regulator [Leucobacter rhizosphaerae]UOQ59876.1 TetR/AcrR family transcriptional regulator [Leucobacter rhizosphaerae]